MDDGSELAGEHEHGQADLGDAVSTLACKCRSRTRRAEPGHDGRLSGDWNAYCSLCSQCRSFSQSWVASSPSRESVGLSLKRQDGPGGASACLARRPAGGGRPEPAAALGCIAQHGTRR